MKTSERGLEFIKEHEGLVLEAYPDPATGGEPWTIGVGHTGSDVHEGLVITEERAMELLRRDVEEAERCIERNVRVPLTQPEFDSLVSWIFNLGCGNFRGSTMLKKLNDSDYDGAAAEIPKWNRAAGKVMAGLTKRRAAERELFESTYA